MKVVWVSDTADSLALAMRVNQEKHSVVFMVKDEEFRQARVGEGLVTLGPPPTLDAIMGERPDLVVFDMVGFGDLAGALKAVGIPVFGASLWADTVELNRSYGTALMTAVGIKTPPTRTFKSFDEAAAFVRKTGKRYVLKPHNNLDTSLTYVARGPEDMLALLEHHVGQAIPEGEEFVLQEYVEGVEVSCEGWFNGTRFIEPFNITFEEKKFMPGNLGPNTGCMGNVVIPLSGRPRLVREGIGRLEDVLRASDYRGPIDLNSIVTPDGLYGLEFTARFGYDAVQALLEGLRRMEIGDLLHRVATGRIDTMPLLHQYLIGVRVTVPPYPHTTRPDVWAPVLGLEDAAIPHIWPCGLRIEKGQVIGCAPDGNLLTVTARGANVREAQRRAYRTIERLIIPDMQYRPDIGERVPDALAKLRSWGWL